MYAVALLLGSVAIFPAARAQFALVCTDGALMADKEDCSKGGYTHIAYSVQRSFFN